MRHREKGDGFAGQRIVVLPRSVVATAQQHPLMNGMMPTDVGYFPRARGHLRDRPAGVGQAIFIYCTRGSGWCELAGQHHTLKTGDLLVVPPWLSHRYGADDVQPWSIHWFHAAGHLLNAFLNELGVNAEHPVVRIGEDPQILALFEELLDGLEHGYSTLQLLYASQTLSHLVAAMIRDHRSGFPEHPNARQKVAQTVVYMKQHLNQALQLDALASVANLSRSQYTALFKEQTGYAPIDYFTRLRMHRACQLLDTAELSVKAVAARIGYQDPLHFSRVFRNVNEMTPTDYRKTRKG